MHIPNDLIDRLMRQGHDLVCEIDPIEPGHRAWVKLVRLTPNPSSNLERMRREGFALRRFELPKAVAEDDMEREPFAYAVHDEHFFFVDITAAFEKAAEFAPDWSRWTTVQDDPDCP